MLAVTLAANQLVPGYRASKQECQCPGSFKYSRNLSHRPTISVLQVTGTPGTPQAPEQWTNMFRVKVAELRQDVAEEHLAQEREPHLQVHFNH